MTLDRQHIIDGTVQELREFNDLIAPMSPRDWQTSTRCAGWRVADVAGHVTGFVVEVSSGRFADLAAPGAPDRQAAERRDRSPAEVAVELREALDELAAQLAVVDQEAWEGAAPPPVAGTLGFGVEAIWYDCYVHLNDILDALGRPSRRGDGLRGAVSHLAGLLSEHRWGPSGLELDGLERFEVGGDGPVVRGDPLTFVLAATGRAHPVEIGYNGRLNVYAD